MENTWRSKVLKVNVLLLSMSGNKTKFEYLTQRIKNNRQQFFFVNKLVFKSLPRSLAIYPYLKSRSHLHTTATLNGNIELTAIQCDRLGIEIFSIASDPIAYGKLALKLGRKSFKVRLFRLAWSRWYHVCKSSNWIENHTQPKRRVITTHLTEHSKTRSMRWSLANLT